MRQENFSSESIFCVSVYSGMFNFFAFMYIQGANYSLGDAATANVCFGEHGAAAFANLLILL